METSILILKPVRLRAFVPLFVLTLQFLIELEEKSKTMIEKIIDFAKILAFLSLNLTSFKINYEVYLTDMEMPYKIVSIGAK